MAKQDAKGGYRIYWQIWLILLVVTLVMIFIDRPAATALQGEAPGGAFQSLLLIVLVLAMLLKAFLIGSYFMHLRFERLFLWMSVVLGLLINGAVLFGLIVPDGLRIYGMLNP
ncbi:MAG: hypothetical protein GY719_15650 [bacterium]|nr:hypothetical protein [bacterium]